MTKILHVISSPRGSGSNSIKLGNAIIDKIREQHPSASVVVKDLTSHPFPHLEEAHLNAFFTPAEKHSAENKQAIMASDKAIAEIFDADIIVIGAPMYNFSISSTLKAWIDHVARAGITFKYTDHGPEGLISGKKVFLAVATGGVYSSGPYQPYDFLVPYLIHILGFLGISDVTVFRAEGFNVEALRAAALDKGIDNIII
jgi:FMN-dependent NADH-azoreductase